MPAARGAAGGATGPRPVRSEHHACGRCQVLASPSPATLRTRTTPPRDGSPTTKPTSTAGRSAEACPPPDEGPLRSMRAGDPTYDGIAAARPSAGWRSASKRSRGPAIAPGPLSHRSEAMAPGARRVLTRPRSPSARARGDHRRARRQEMPREVPSGRSSHRRPSSDRAQQSSSPALAGDRGCRRIAAVTRLTHAASACRSSRSAGIPRPSAITSSTQRMRSRPPGSLADTTSPGRAPRSASPTGDVSDTECASGMHLSPADELVLGRLTGRVLDAQRARRAGRHRRAPSRRQRRPRKRRAARAEQSATGPRSGRRALRATRHRLPRYRQRARREDAAQGRRGASHVATRARVRVRRIRRQ